MAKNKKMSTKTKGELKHTKMRMHEQLIEKKKDQSIESAIGKRIETNVKVSKYSIINSGVQNKFKERSDEYSNLLSDYKKLSINLKQKSKKGTKQEILNLKKKMFVLDTEIKKARRLYKIEKIKLKNEIKQINKLNKIPNGKTKLGLDPKLSIQVNNANKIYTTKSVIFEALNEVNLEIKKGSFNVIVGPSGSGKTTLLNIISGLDRSTTGVVNINGTNIQALKNGEITQFRRRNIGFVFQSYNLLTSLNVKDNVEIGRSLQTDSKKRKKIQTILEEMNIGRESKKMTYELSGGQQQRVSIARALAKSPNILIGDEPTGALDQKTARKVFELFKDINKKQNATVIIVTHNPKVALMADQVITVKDGKIESIVQNKKPKTAAQVFGN